MVDPLTPVLVKTGAAAAKGIFPWIFGKVQMWATGKTVIVVGPSRSGKTSFLDYLELGILRVEQQTRRTMGLEPRYNFVIEVGKDQRLKIRVRKPFDSSGDVAPFKQVEYIERQRPHGIVVILDAVRFKILEVEPEHPEELNESCTAWLTELCIHLNKLLNTNEKVAQTLKAMIVVINKWDKLPKVDDNAEKKRKEEFEETVRSILDKHLNNKFYSKDGTGVVNVLPCALVNNQLDDALVKEVISTLALSLR